MNAKERSEMDGGRDAQYRRYISDEYTHTKSVVRHGSASQFAAHGFASQSSVDVSELPGSSGPSQHLKEGDNSSDSKAKAWTYVSNQSTETEKALEKTGLEVEALKLEYRCIESTNADLELAYNAYWHVRASHRTSMYPLAVMRTGIVLNGLQRQLGPNNLQMATVMLQACNGVRVHDDWKFLEQHNLTPANITSFLVEGTSSLNSRQRLNFTTGIWKDRSLSLGDIQNIRRQDGIFGVLPVFFALVEFNRSVLAQVEDKRSLYQPTGDEERLLAYHFSEHWALALGFGFTDYQEPTSDLPLALPSTSNTELPVWQGAVELAELSEVQLRQCESARRHSKAQQKRLDASNKRLQEGLSVLIDLPQEHGTEKAILNIIEDLRKNHLHHRRIITESGFVFLFKILSPSQAALFYGYIQGNLKHPIAHFTDWMLYIHNFLCDETESRWMDTYSITHMPYRDKISHRSFTRV